MKQSEMFWKWAYHHGNCQHIKLMSKEIAFLKQFHDFEIGGLVISDKI